VPQSDTTYSISFPMRLPFAGKRHESYIRVCQEMAAAFEASSNAAAPCMSGDDPLDYATFIVYLKRKGNDELRRLCADHSELVLQCVEDIEHAGTKPSWLRGVPTVVRLPSYEILTGTQALDAIRKWASSRPKAMGMAQPSSVGASLMGPESLAADGEDPVSGFSSLEELLRRREEGSPDQKQQRRSPGA
jgi:hypothetical protein